MPYNINMSSDSNSNSSRKSGSDDGGISLHSVKYDRVNRRYRWLRGRTRNAANRSVGSISSVSSFSSRSSSSSSGGGSSGSGSSSSNERRDTSISSSSSSRSSRREMSENESSSSDGDESSSGSSSSSSSVVHLPLHIQILTDVDVLLEGLLCAGFEVKRQKRVKLDKNLERFKAYFGVGPVATAKVMVALKEKYGEINYRDCLMGMNWLKLYLTLPVMEGIWKLCDKVISKRVKKYVSRIQSLKDNKIRMPNFHPDEIYIISVDGVHFMTEEFLLDPSSKWYCFKKNSPGLVSLFY